MEIILTLIGLVCLVSLYDFFAARKWQQVTSVERNEIVFANRNKAYGAYVMRKNYDKQLALIIGGVILLISLLYGIHMIIKSIPEPIEEEAPIDMTQFTMAAPPEEEEVPPPIEELPPPTEKTLAFTPPVVTDEIVEEEIPIQEDLEDVKVSTETNEGEDSFVVTENAVVKPVVVEKKEEVIETVVDEPAEYPGGAGAFKQFLVDNIKYPQIAIEEELEGKVWIQFVVDTKGSVSNVKVLKGVPNCPECDKEAVRVIKLSKNWTPGKNNGKAVKSYHRVPVDYKLE
jgi:periplasmic protein TonB